MAEKSLIAHVQQDEKEPPQPGARARAEPREAAAETGTAWEVREGRA